ncbi:MAG: hypothetical protein WCF57_11210 [Pyrinomonadaceae bacterium]
MESPLSYRMTIAMKLCALVALGLYAAPAARGQELLTELTAPPPMKFVSRDERAQLSATPDPKERARVGIEIAEGHLRHAEEATFTRSYDPASAAMGRYQAVIDDTLRYLGAINSDNKKMRDIFKRLEITLRAHITRIEAIRRDTPFEHSVNIRAVLEFARNARTEALNIFYSDTVVREDLPDNTKPSDNNRSKGSPSNPQKNPL